MTVAYRKASKVFQFFPASSFPRSIAIVLPSRRRLVAEEDIPISEGSRLCTLQVQFLFDAVEHRPPLAQNDGVHHDLVFIDQTLLCQLRDNTAASQNHHIVSGLLLNLSCFCR